MPGGLAVFDFDGDGFGLFSLTAVTCRPGGRHSPFKRTGYSGTRANAVEDVTSKSGLSGTEYSFGAAVGDYDRDGRPDLLVSHLHGVTLYRNRGGGSFEDVTKPRGIDNKLRWSVGAAWFDFNDDGHLDLYVVNYVGWEPKAEPECRVAGRIDFATPGTINLGPAHCFGIMEMAHSQTSAMLRELEDIPGKVWLPS
ncbi:MAG: VCBS repeat-containing protein [Bryobacteraceae bacterium]